MIMLIMMMVIVMILLLLLIIIIIVMTMIMIFYVDLGVQNFWIYIQWLSIVNDNSLANAIKLRWCSGTSQKLRHAVNQVVLVRLWDMKKRKRFTTESIVAITLITFLDHPKLSCDLLDGTSLSWSNGWTNIRLASDMKWHDADVKSM